jgi:hypothetical protein
VPEPTLGGLRITAPAQLSAVRAARTVRSRTQLENRPARVRAQALERRLAVLLIVLAILLPIIEISPLVR